MMIEEKVKELLNEKEWTFADLQEMGELVNNFTDKLYNELSAKEKIDLVWDEHLSGEMIEVEFDKFEATFGQIFYKIVFDKLAEKVIDVVKNELMGANVIFGDKNKEDKNEVPKRSVGRKPSKKRPTNEKTNSKE